jgi:hypothetical protein
MPPRKEPDISGSSNAILGGFCLSSIGTIFLWGAHSLYGLLPLLIGLLVMAGGISAKLRGPRN